LGDSPDINSFLWGMLAGFIATVVVEGVALYFTWPYLASALTAWGAVKK
jgi:hypothetical protein